MTSTAGQGSNGAGFQTPNDTASDVNAVAFAVRRIMAMFDTMKLVRVVKVTPGTGTPPGPTFVDVKPLVQQVDGNGNAVAHGIVPNIPVRRLQGGAGAIIMDPKVDDVGYVVAADRDSSKVKNAGGKESPPGSRRTFNIADGVYEGAVLMTPPETYLWIKDDGSFKFAAKGGWVLESDASGNAAMTSDGGSVGVTLNADGTLKLAAAGGFVLQTDGSGNVAITPGGGTVTLNGALHATGAIIAGFGGADQVGLQTHAHFGTSGGAPIPGT